MMIESRYDVVNTVSEWISRKMSRDSFISPEKYYIKYRALTKGSSHSGSSNAPPKRSR
jgi:hypothetical protein